MSYIYSSCSYSLTKVWFLLSPCIHAKQCWMEPQQAGAKPPFYRWEHWLPEVTVLAGEFQFSGILCYNGLLFKADPQNHTTPTVFAVVGGWCASVIWVGRAAPSGPQCCNYRLLWVKNCLLGYQPASFQLLGKVRTVFTLYLFGLHFVANASVVQKNIPAVGCIPLP